VKVGLILKSFAMLAVVLFVCTGCGGFNATPAFSPLMFFLPGLASSKKPPGQNPPQPTQVSTNWDLALAN
jgi:hypothetical protein